MSLSVLLANQLKPLSKDVSFHVDIIIKVNLLNHRDFYMNNISPLLLLSLVLIAGCSNNSSQYPSSEGMAPPYILKEDCKFTIVEELSKASITSPTVTAMDRTSASMGVSLGDKSIMVSNCQIVSNSHSLPIYED